MFHHRVVTSLQFKGKPLPIPQKATTSKALRLPLQLRELQDPRHLHPGGMVVGPLKRTFIGDHPTSMVGNAKLVGGFNPSEKKNSQLG